MKHLRDLAILALVLLTCPAGFASPGHILRAKYPVRNQYLVQFATRELPGRADALMREFGGRVLYNYEIINGLLVELTPAQALALSFSPFVAVVEENAIIPSASTTVTGLLTPDNPAAPTRPSRW